MGKAVSLAVVGAGMAGRQHIDAMAQLDSVCLACIVDTSATAKDYAASMDVPWYASLADMPAAELPDGVIVATPNQMHVEHGLASIAAGLPTLMEKPIATDSAGAQRIVDAADAAGIPLLVGHHRRFSPIAQAARQKLKSGALGKIVAVHGMCWLFKPAEYFDTAWRRGTGAGPVFINLIHDVDLLRYLCGEIASVYAFEARSVRGYDAEETVVVALTFESGALGTLTVSDTVVSPWSWELAAKENPAYPEIGQFCYLIGGTHGSLELPVAGFWSNAGARGWWEPINRQKIDLESGVPLVRQLRHFCRVIRGEEMPLVSGLEGLKSLRVIEAIKRSVHSCKPVDLLKEN